MIGATQEVDVDKTVETILTHATLAKGVETALTDCDEHTDLSRVIAFTLRVQMTFAADVSADPTVSIYASPTAVNGDYDTTAWKTWTFPRTVSETVTLHWPEDDEIKPLPKYIKVLVKNNSAASGAEDITSITVKKVPLAI